MASFSRNIDDVKLVTYEDVVAFHDLLINVSQKLKLEKPDLELDIQFYIGDISCACENYEEFVEHAYGAKGFDLISAYFRIFDGDKSVVYVGYIGHGAVDASADSKLMLEQFLNQVHEEQKHTKQENTVIMQNIVDSVVVTGNGNIIANNDSEIEIEHPQTESRSKAFWSGILQNVASNFIWYLLTFSAGILIAYLTNN